MAGYKKVKRYLGSAPNMDEGWEMVGTVIGFRCYMKHKRGPWFDVKLAYPGYIEHKANYKLVWNRVEGYFAQTDDLTIMEDHGGMMRWGVEKFLKSLGVGQEYMPKKTSIGYEPDPELGWVLTYEIGDWKIYSKQTGTDWVNEMVVFAGETEGHAHYNLGWSAFEERFSDNYGYRLLVKERPELEKQLYAKNLEVFKWSAR